MSIYEEVEVLRSIRPFSVLDERKLKILAFASKLMIYTKGQVVIMQGDPGDSLYVLIEGKANAWIEQDDEAAHVSEIGPNTIFGEIAVLRDTPRFATVIAATKMVALKTSKIVMDRLIAEETELRLKLEQYIDDAGYSKG